MRKGLENVLLILGYVFSILLIVILIIAITEAAPLEELLSSFVKTLVYLATIGFFATAVFYCYLMFSAGKTVNEVLIYQSELSKTKITRSVVKKLILQAIAKEEFAKVKRVRLIAADNVLHFTVYVELSESNVPYLIDYLKALIADMFEHTLKLTAYTTDFKVKKLKIDYEVPREEILKEVDKQYKENCDAQQEASKKTEEKLIDKTAQTEEISEPVNEKNDEAAEVSESADNSFEDSFNDYRKSPRIEDDEEEIEQ